MRGTIESEPIINPKVIRRFPKGEEFIGGIPKPIFYSNTGESGFFYGRSKKVLTYTLFEDEIFIGDVLDSDFHFNASIDSSYLVLDLQTKKKTNTGKIIRHPDLYAKELSLWSYSFFVSRGHEILGLSDCWFKDEKNNDNYAQYKRALSKTVSSGFPTKEQIEEAAFKTWSGKLSLDLGFINISSIWENKTNFFVVFSKGNLSGFPKPNK